MTLTLIVVCAHCGGLLLAKREQKTRTCPYCGARVDVEKAKTVASAENAIKASEILKELKSGIHKK
jgi:DNA-directed RNA polymerase subunit RPC12/RpoP